MGDRYEKRKVHLWWFYVHSMLIPGGIWCDRCSLGFNYHVRGGRIMMARWAWIGLDWCLNGVWSTPNNNRISRSLEPELRRLWGGCVEIRGRLYLCAIRSVWAPFVSLVKEWRWEAVKALYRACSMAADHVLPEDGVQQLLEDGQYRAHGAYGTILPMPVKWCHQQPEKCTFRFVAKMGFCDTWCDIWCDTLRKIKVRVYITKYTVWIWVDRGSTL